jgi:hypothetical protein
MRRRTPALALAGLLALTGVAGCSEEEQADLQQQIEEGAQDVQEGVEDGAERVEEEIDENTEGGG